MQSFSINSCEIPKFLHTRYPFLMIDHVDKVIPGKLAKGYKNLTNNEWLFKNKGSFNIEMPDSILLEILEEMLIITIRTVDGMESEPTRFVSADFKFYEKIYPGSRLDISSEVKSFRRGILNGFGNISVNEKIVCEGKLLITFPGIANNFLPQKNK